LFKSTTPPHLHTYAHTLTYLCTKNMSSSGALTVPEGLPAEAPALVLAAIGAGMELKEALELKVQPIPAVPDGHVLIEVLAAGVNPSDFKETQGAFPFAKTGVIVGRDFCGRVVVGPPNLLGRVVFGTGGKDRGYISDGAIAKYTLVSADGVLEKPTTLSDREAGCLGVPFVTAATALRKAQLQPGETVLTVGANGFVAKAALNIAKWRSADTKTIGLVRRSVEVPFADAVIDTSQTDDVVKAVLDQTAGKGVDVVIDCVGNDVERSMQFLGHGGRLVILSSPGGDTQFAVNIRAFYRKDLTLHSTETMQYDAVQSAAILSELLPGFASGEVKPPLVNETVFPLQASHDAYEAVKAGSPTRVVVSPAV